MILTTKGKLAGQVYAGKQGKRFPADLFSAALRAFTKIEAAAELNDLRFPPSNRLEALKGDRTGQYSIRINAQWRVCFSWTEGGAEDVEIVDYH